MRPQASQFKLEPVGNAKDVPRDQMISVCIARSWYDDCKKRYPSNRFSPRFLVVQKNGASVLGFIGTTSMVDLNADVDAGHHEFVKFTWTPGNVKHLFTPGAAVEVALRALPTSDLPMHIMKKWAFTVEPAKPIRLQYKLNDDRPKVANVTFGETPLDDLAQSICERMCITPASIDKIVRIVLEFQF